MWRIPKSHWKKRDTDFPKKHGRQRSWTGSWSPMFTAMTGDSIGLTSEQCLYGVLGQYGLLGKCVSGRATERSFSQLDPCIRSPSFRPGIATDFHLYPRGALTAHRSNDEVTVDLGDLHIICKPDKTWHYTVEDKKAGIIGEFVHTGNGFPPWYGKEKPQAYTPHSISYGYFWSGTVEGTLTIQGRKVAITGAGVRERYYAVDTCPAEVGAWHDWMWFHFDEMSGALDEMKVSQNKDMSLYLADEKQYFPAGRFDITHCDWAYLPSNGVFIPTRYEVSIETEAGVLEMAANAVSAYVASGIRDVPDSPTTLLDWDRLDGTFTYKDGRKRTLTNGLGGTLIRQWKPYPSILITGAGRKAEDVPRI